MTGEYVVHGGDESYYTGKLEAYLRAKGISYRLERFGRASIERCARNTGVVQIPQVECPDGTWLVDTTPTIAFLERARPEPAISPAAPAVRFVALLLEDYADEWLWRPAMHYRWSYPDSARLVSGWLAAHFPEIPLPFVAKKLFWRVRQTAFFVRLDGVTRETRAAVEASYLETLDALEAIFAARPFVLGARPTQADFGFFASMFRHFFCDPASGRIMRDRAPGVQEWVARLWNLSPARFAGAPSIETIPSGLEPLFRAVAGIYLPYLVANADAYARGEAKVAYGVQGVRFREPVKPYRVWCLAELRRELAALDVEAREAVRRAIPDAAFVALDRPPPARVPAPLPVLPIGPGSVRRPVDSWWRGR